VNAAWSRLELRTRLVLAFLGILLGALGASWLVTTLAGPRLFRDRLKGSGSVPEATLHRAESAFRSVNAIEMLFVTAVALVLILVVSTVSSRSILASLSRFVSAAESVAGGDYGVRVPARLAGRELDTVAAAFNDMAERVQSVEATRRRMLADLAHEMATPLANLDGYLEGIEDGVVTLDNDVIGVLRGQVSRLARLTDDIHAVSAADEGRLGLNLESIRIAEVVRDAADAIRPAYAEKHVKLVVDEDADVVARADRERLSQVMTNLLKNALRHTPPGGDVRVRIESRRDAVSVLVRDTGEGIAPEHLPHVFERFYRAHPASGDTVGSGIGLTISRAIVAGHRGRIEVHSDGVGRGTDVRITLPRDA